MGGAAWAEAAVDEMIEVADRSSRIALLGERSGHPRAPRQAVRRPPPRGGGGRRGCRARVSGDVPGGQRRDVDRVRDRRARRGRPGRAAGRADERPQRAHDPADRCASGGARPGSDSGPRDAAPSCAKPASAGPPWTPSATWSPQASRAWRAVGRSHGGVTIAPSAGSVSSVWTSTSASPGCPSWPSRPPDEPVVDAEREARSIFERLDAPPFLAQVDRLRAERTAGQLAPQARRRPRGPPSERVRPRRHPQPRASISHPPRTLRR